MAGNKNGDFITFNDPPIEEIVSCRILSRYILRFIDQHYPHIQMSSGISDDLTTSTIYFPDGVTALVEWRRLTYYEGGDICPLVIYEPMTAKFVEKRPSHAFGGSDYYYYETTYTSGKALNTKMGTLQKNEITGQYTDINWEIMIDHEKNQFYILYPSGNIKSGPYNIYPC